MKKLLILIALLAACGKNHSGQNCQDRKKLVFQCIQNHTHNYGLDYAIRLCNQSYYPQQCGVYR